MRACSLILALTIAALCAPSAHALSGADVENFRQLIEKGNSLMLRKQFPAAVAIYEQALQIDPDDPQARSIVSINLSETQNHWGIQYYNQRNFKEAIAHFQAAVKINPKNAQAKRNISLAQQAIERVARTTQDMSDDESHGSSPYDEETVVGGKKSDEQGDSDNALSVKSDSATRPKSDAPPARKTNNPSKDPSKNPAKEPAKDPGDVFSSSDADDSAARQSRLHSDRSASPRAADDVRLPAGGVAPAGGTAQAPVESPDSDLNKYGPAMIITPETKKMMEQQRAAETGAATPYSTPASSGGSASVSTYPPAYTSSSPSTTSAPASNYGRSAAPLPGGAGYHTADPTYPVVPQQFNSQPSAPPMVTPNLGAAPNAAPASGGGSLDESLTAIEMNVMGHRQSDMTVLQRLEKIETMTDGQIRTGTVIERIDLLRKKYGL